MAILNSLKDRFLGSWKSSLLGLIGAGVSYVMANPDVLPPEMLEGAKDFIPVVIALIGLTRKDKKV